MSNKIYETMLANDKARKRSTHNGRWLRERVGSGCQRLLCILVFRQLLKRERRILCAPALPTTTGERADERGVLVRLAV